MAHFRKFPESIRLLPFCDYFVNGVFIQGSGVRYDSLFDNGPVPCLPVSQQFDKMWVLFERKIDPLTSESPGSIGVWFVSSEKSSQYGVEVSELKCRACGAKRLRRILRQGFMQLRIYPLFGYYPWECAACRKIVMLRKRHQRRRSARPAETAKPE